MPSQSFALRPSYSLDCKSLLLSAGQRTIDAQLTSPTFISLAVGEELAQPFGFDSNDIDLDLLCYSIYLDLEEISKARPPGHSQVWVVASDDSKSDLMVDLN